MFRTAFKCSSFELELSIQNGKQFARNLNENICIVIITLRVAWIFCKFCCNYTVNEFL